MHPRIANRRSLVLRQHAEALCSGYRTMISAIGLVRPYAREVEEQLDGAVESYYKAIKLLELGALDEHSLGQIATALSGAAAAVLHLIHAIEMVRPHSSIERAGIGHSSYQTPWTDVVGAPDQ